MNQVAPRPTEGPDAALREATYDAMRAALRVALTAADYETIIAQCGLIAGFRDVDQLLEQAQKGLAATAGQPDPDQELGRRAERKRRQAKALAWASFALLSFGLGWLAIAGSVRIRETVRSRRVDAAIAMARSAREQGRWDVAASAADRVLMLDKRHAEALSIHREAVDARLPRLRVVATLAEREVPAKLSLLGEHSVTTPTVVLLETGRSHFPMVAWESEGRHFSVNLGEVVADWEGVREVRVPLDGRSSPFPGEELGLLLGDGSELALVWCPPGSFVMGSPGNEMGRCDDEAQHRVILTNGFWIGRHEVTRAQWRAVMDGDLHRSAKPGEDTAMDCISWEDCQTLLQRLNAQLPGGGFRLPTEAEWEYACRAGTTTALNSGRNLTSARGMCHNLDPLAWYEANSDGGEVQPVGRKLPNGWGLHDMHGNVWEWCRDRYGRYGHGSVTDPLGGSSGPYRVARGGGATSSADLCRSARRFSGSDTNRTASVGMRLVADIPDMGKVLAAVERGRRAAAAAERKRAEAEAATKREADEKLRAEEAERAKRAAEETERLRRAVAEAERLAEERRRTAEEERLRAAQAERARQTAEAAARLAEERRREAEEERLRASQGETSRRAGPRQGQAADDGTRRVAPAERPRRSSRIPPAF